MNLSQISLRQAACGILRELSSRVSTQLGSQAMNRLSPFLLVLLMYLAPIVAAAPQRTPLKPLPERAAEIAAMLGNQPFKIGPAITDREAWSRIAASLNAAQIIARAHRHTQEPMPDTSRQLYLDFSQNGNRTRYQDPYFAKRRRLYDLVVAECLEDRGAFLPAIEKTIRSICDEPTWCLPAHDRWLDNLEGRERTIDLFIAETAWDLAIADQWLGDRLSTDLRQEIRHQLAMQVFEPFEKSVRTGKPKHFWLHITNNWNAVCLAGVTGAALTTLEDRDRRSFYVSTAENFIENFLAGFGDDGYCTEGISYWNYGVGHYLNLAETLLQASRGGIDLYAHPKTQLIATSPWKMQIAPDVYPSFSDTPLESQPQPLYTTLLSERLDLPSLTSVTFDQVWRERKRPHFYELGLYGLEFATADKLWNKKPSKLSLRDSYPDSGVFVMRPASGDREDLAIVVKGGHNNEHHNHNDVGTFVVALGSETPLFDPGREVYTSRTFSSRRYESDLLNSFGHPVPRVAGQLQRTGRSAEATIVSKSFSPQRDKIEFDLSSAYDVDGLEKLTRTFEYYRRDDARIVIVDRVEFSEPREFESALITNKPWRRISPSHYQIGGSGREIEVKVECVNNEFEFTKTPISEDTGGAPQPTRLGFLLAQPARKAELRFEISRRATESTESDQTEVKLPEATPLERPE